MISNGKIVVGLSELQTTRVHDADHFQYHILTFITKQVPIPFLPQVYSKIVLLLWRAYLARIKRGYLKAPWHAVENE